MDYWIGHRMVRLFQSHSLDWSARISTFFIYIFSCVSSDFTDYQYTYELFYMSSDRDVESFNQCHLSKNNYNKVIVNTNSGETSNKPMKAFISFT